MLGAKKRRDALNVEKISPEMWKQSVDFPFGSKCRPSIWQFHALQSFNFTTFNWQKVGRKGAGISLFDWRQLGFMFPSNVHPEGIWRWSVKAAMGTVEPLRGLVFCFKVPPQVGELAGDVVAVVFTMIQAVLPPLVLHPWKILLKYEKLSNGLLCIFPLHYNIISNREIC